MRVIAISDTHHLHYYLDLPEGDMLLHAGDFSYRGERIEQMLVLEWIERQSERYKHVVFVSGNHDINFGPTQSIRLPNNCHHLHDSGIEIDGVYFYGSAYTPRFGDWGWGETEDKLEKRFSHIPKKTQVLITHGPPYSILDANKNGQKCGSTSLYQKIKKLPDLKHHIFGHIHESYGQEVIEGITFSNVSILNEYYKIQNNSTLINIDNKK